MLPPTMIKTLALTASAVAFAIGAPVAAYVHTQPRLVADAPTQVSRPTPPPPWSPPKATQATAPRERYVAPPRELGVCEYPSMFDRPCWCDREGCRDDREYIDDVIHYGPPRGRASFHIAPSPERIAR